MAKHREEEEAEGNNERWLLTYSDLITLLLALFIMFYSMSTIDAEKFKALAEQMGSTLGGGHGGGYGVLESGDSDGGSSGSSAPDPSSASSSGSSGSSGSGEGTQLENEFSQLYEMLKKNIEETGYADKIAIDKTNDYIHFRFKDSVLFYPDSPQMREDGFPIIQYIGDSIYDVKYLVKSILIEGHTADDGDETSSNFYAWNLSSNRAIAVLEYLVTKCNMPQSVMSTAGYSRFQPIADNATEAGRAMNRRVEITITRVAELDSVSSSVTTESAPTDTTTTSSTSHE